MGGSGSLPQDLDPVDQPFLGDLNPWNKSDCIDCQASAIGGLTLYVQHESPGTDAESDWLPAPNGPFFIAMRLYWPKPKALDGTWKRPEMVRTP